MTKIISVVFAVVFGVLFVTIVASAVTTISTAITTAGDITTSAGNIEATAGTLTVGGASTLTGDVTLSGGNGALAITHANAATSTITVGCVQTYATSAATAIHLEFHATGTAGSTFATSTNGYGMSQGLVIWKYGACPLSTL